MKKVVKEKKVKYPRIIGIIDWLIHMIAYSLILYAASLLFKKTVDLDISYYGIWAFTTAIIIYILNKTIKPFIVWLTLPITALTLGLFYPVINVLILNIVDIILGSHFDIRGFLMSFVVAVSISLVNEITSEFIIKPIVRKVK